MAAQLQDLSDYAMDLQDQYGIINDDERSPLTAAFQKGWLKAPSSRIAVNLYRLAHARPPLYQEIIDYAIDLLTTQNQTTRQRTATDTRQCQLWITLHLAITTVAPQLQARLTQQAEAMQPTT